MGRVSFHPLARRELIDAALYYDLESQGLGAAFLDAVEHSLQTLSQFPESGPIIRGKVRRKVLARFPYALLYSLKQDTIRILAVMNLKRRPIYWVGRE